MNAIEGFLGGRWGDDASIAAAHLGLNCKRWEDWEGRRGYEACFDIDHLVDAFSHKVYVRLFRRQNRLAGLSLRFKQCGATRDELAAAVGKAFDLKVTEGKLYTVFEDGSMVHLDYDSADDTCELTVAGPSFGQAFADYLLEQGFKNLATGLRP